MINGCQDRQRNITNQTVLYKMNKRVGTGKFNLKLCPRNGRNGRSQKIETVSKGGE